MNDDEDEWEFDITPSWGFTFWLVGFVTGIVICKLDWI